MGLGSASAQQRGGGSVHWMATATPAPRRCHAARAHHRALQTPPQPPRLEADAQQEWPRQIPHAHSLTGGTARLWAVLGDGHSALVDTRAMRTCMWGSWRDDIISCSTSPGTRPWSAQSPTAPMNAASMRRGSEASTAVTSRATRGRPRCPESMGVTTSTSSTPASEGMTCTQLCPCSHTIGAPDTGQSRLCPSVSTWWSVRRRPPATGGPGLTPCSARSGRRGEGATDRGPAPLVGGAHVLASTCGYGC